MKDSNPPSSRHIIPLSIGRKAILETLGQLFTVKSTGNSSDKVVLVDSFDWGLFSNGLLAMRLADNNLTFWSSDNLFDADQASIVESDDPQAKFWWEFRTSPQREQLRGMLGLRALMPLSEGVLKGQTGSLQDAEGKTLVFFQIVAFTRTASARKPLFCQIKLIAATGYEEQQQQAQQLLRDLGCFEPSLPPIDSFLGAIGVTPRPYTVKPELSIDPAMPARTAVNSIISQMIEKQRLNERGVIDDIDTEFLHHFRVALRMVRAAIAQLKEVYPEQDVLSLKNRFGKLARETNHLRDLDVFILDKGRYLDLLPASLADGLLPMFDDFERDRANEVKRVANWLKSAAYRREMRELQALFEKGYPACETEWSEKPCIELAVSKINKRYRKIQKAALKITAETPDEIIHGIRIDCKKLRYLLYFFGDLFDDKALKLAGKQLKRLQDRLGIFNDLSVQGKYLEHYLQESERKENKDVYLIAALGGLIATLYSMQKLSREECIRELHIFSAKRNRELFREAFALEATAA